MHDALRHWVSLETRSKANQRVVGSTSGHGCTVFEGKGRPIPWQGEEQGAMVPDLARGGGECSSIRFEFHDVLDGDFRGDGEFCNTVDLISLEEDELRCLVRVVAFTSQGCKLGRLVGVAEDVEVVKDNDCNFVFVKGKEQDGGFVVVGAPHHVESVHESAEVPRDHGTVLDEFAEAT